MNAETFLTQIISTLSTSPDLQTTIQSLARQAITAGLADWCGIYMFENEQHIRRLAVAPMAHAEAVFRLDLHATTGPAYVRRTRTNQLLTDPGPDIVQGLGFQLEELGLPNGLGPSRYACIPAIARNETIGAIVLMSVEPRRQFDATEIILSGNLANVAAVAMDTSKIYSDAQEANRLKDEFVAMVSHELRTPLTPILGCVHLLRTATLTSANLDRALELIERNAQTQVQIVEDLLDVSRIVAGKLHLTMKSISVIPVVEAAIETIRSSGEANKVEIITDFEDVQTPIDGDPHRLQQIIWNLLSNAVKFTPAGGRIEISVRSDGSHLRVQVTDTGVGMPAEFLPHVFDRFRQAENSSRMRTGLGLGLAIVRHLVELHNGSIEAASAGPGKGAVFTLRFPFVARRAAAIGQAPN